MRSIRSMKFLSTAGASAVCAALVLVTSIWPNWIERTSGIDLDQHSGATEWQIVATLVIVGAAMGIAARAEWRRQRLLTSA